MARSVSYPRNAVAAFSEYEGEDEFEWSWLVEDFVERLKAKYASVHSHSGWLGREDRIVAANEFAFFGVSEYCGLVAFWVVAREDRYGSASYLAESWVAQIAKGFEAEFGSLRKLGHMSNGEGVYERKAA